MESIGSFEAKTHLPALLQRVARGETIIITKHGKPVARLVPPEQVSASMTIQEVIAGFGEFRNSHKLSRAEIRDLIREGRKR